MSDSRCSCGWWLGNERMIKSLEQQDLHFESLLERAKQEYSKAMHEIDDENMDPDTVDLQCAKVLDKYKKKIFNINTDRETKRNKLLMLFGIGIGQFCCKQRIIGSKGMLPPDTHN